MTNYQKDENLISRAENALVGVRKILDQLNVLHSDLENLSREYREIEFPPPYVEVHLRASVLLFESYFMTHLSLRPPSPEELTLAQENRLNLFLEGDWLTHEMGSLLFSVNTIFQLFALRDVGLGRVRGEKETPQTRKDVYDHAKLFYYLRPDEELKIRRIHFSSPGDMELVTQLTSLVPALRDTIAIILLARLATRLVRELPSLLRHTIEELTRTKQIIRDDQLRRILHDEIIKKIKEKTPQNLTEIEAEQVHNAVALLDKTINQVTAYNVADPIRLTTRIFDALSSIARLFDVRKISTQAHDKEKK